MRGKKLDLKMEKSADNGADCVFLSVAIYYIRRRGRRTRYVHELKLDESGGDGK